MSMIPAQSSFRDAMRRLAATVTIVSTISDGRRHGMTATAVTSLSMDPPSLLVCVNRGGALHPLLSRSGRFCVNLLRSEQAALSEAFSGKLTSEERFLRGDWAADGNGVPYLTDAQANVFCDTSETVHFGSHSIFIGMVEDVKTSANVCPLLYGNGSYGRYAPLALSA